MDKGAIVPGDRVNRLAPVGLETVRGPEILEVEREETPHLLDYWHLILERRWTVLL